MAFFKLILSSKMYLKSLPVDKLKLRGDGLE